MVKKYTPKVFHKAFCYICGPCSSGCKPSEDNVCGVGQCLCEHETAYVEDLMANLEASLEEARKKKQS